MNPENTLCLIIDIQERLLPALHDKDDMLHHSRVLIQGLHALGVPFAVTEQYPKGLGKTVPAISLLLPETTPFIEKTRFSALSPETHAILTQAAVQNIVLIGAETHICMLQTVLDLRLEGFPSGSAIARYHSWVVDMNSCTSTQANLVELAYSLDDDGRQTMALRHKTLPIWGLQFHPESMISEYGARYISNWLSVVLS